MFGFVRRFDKTDWLVLLLGFLVTIKIRLIGMFSGAELLLFVILLFGNKTGFVRNKYVLKLIVFAFLWIIGTIISNIHNNVGQLDFIKGVFFLVVLLVIIPPIYTLMSDKPERLILFFLGYGIGQLFARYTTTEEELAEALSADVYIFYAYLSFISAIGYCLYFIGMHKIGVLICYGMCILGLFNMARNPFLTGTIAFLLLILISFYRHKDYDINMKRYRKKLPFYFIFGMLAIFAADSVYEPLAANGTLGEDAQLKYYEQQANGANALEGGRSDTFMGIDLIKDNPIWGYGSYAKDEGDAFHLNYAIEHNTEYKWYMDEDRQLPGHSHIVGAWVENGIFGGLFWLYVLWIFWKVFKSGCIMCEPRLLCLMMFQSCAFMWNLFFSPFGDRTFTMFFIITLLIIYDKAQRGLYQKHQVKKLKL